MQLAGVDLCKLQVIQTTKWIIPTLQTIHILAIAALFSSAILFDLRLWGVVERDLPLKDMARRFFPVIWFALPVLLTSGAFLIVGEPKRARAPTRPLSQNGASRLRHSGDALAFNGLLSAAP